MEESSFHSSQRSPVSRSEAIKARLPRASSPGVLCRDWQGSQCALRVPIIYNSRAAVRNCWRPVHEMSEANLSRADKKTEHTFAHMALPLYLCSFDGHPCVSPVCSSPTYPPALPRQHISNTIPYEERSPENRRRLTHPHRVETGDGV